MQKHDKLKQKNENLVLQEEQVENTDLYNADLENADSYKPVLNKIMTTRE